MTSESQPETPATPAPVVDYRLRLPELAEYRAAAVKRRAAAFCDVPEDVLCIPVQPLTPRTYSMLLAKGNRFIVGGMPKIDDVVDYLWLHAANWTHCGVDGWELRKRQHLRPLTVQLRQPWRRFLRLKPRAEHAAAAMALAIVDIKRIVDEAFADTIAATGAPGAPIATLEAHFIHLMGVAYQWAPERTRVTPLKQLFQLNRCIRQARGDTVQDAGEEMILYRHLKAKNDALAAARAAQKEEAAT